MTIVEELERIARHYHVRSLNAESAEAKAAFSDASNTFRQIKASISTSPYMAGLRSVDPWKQTSEDGQHRPEQSA
jgi:hypothetical protein